MANRNVVLAVVAVLLAAPERPRAAESARFSFDATPGALSKDVVPSRYRLAFDVDPARSTFSGETAIAIRVRKAVPAIGLHAKELEARSAVLVAADGSRRTLRVTPGKEPVAWRLETDPPSPIAAGDYTLEISYAGRVRASEEGLYVAPYEVNGRKEAMLDTQLEAIHARRLFPAFDEPSFRAVFEISVTAPSRYEVVSNMPEAGREASGDSVTHRFQPTPPMPTYLVAFAVGRFDALPGKASGIPLRILTAEGRGEKARFALEVTKQVIPFYTAYFGLPYALPKLDQLALPSTRNGAMEDWGFIAYTEEWLLFDPATSSPRTQREVASTVAHEIAHQWFGNLVTAASWEEIWLNEAFATWMAQKAMERFHPEWRPDLRRRQAMDAVMERDAGPSTRPIRSGPVNESAVNDVFDDVTYTKGGAVLSMLEQWIGPDAFRRGLGAYMRERRLSNATAADLWHHLAKASGKDVASVASTWTDQDGFPLVQVSSRCVGGQTQVLLKQERFSLGTGSLPPRIWKIPIRLSRGQDRRTFLLGEAERSIRLPACSKAPLLANAGGLGFYRVEYGPDELQRLAGAFPSLSAPDRTALLGDTFALAQAGRTSMASFFALLAALPGIQDESRTKLFGMAFMALEFLDETMAGTPAQARVRAAGRALFGPALSELGWEEKPGESAEAARLRGSLIAMLADFDDGPVTERAREVFDAHVAGRALLPASIRSSVVQAVGIHADRPHFDLLVSLLRSSTGDEDRWMYASALASGRDPGRAREVLESSLSDTLPTNIASAIPSLMGATSPNGVMAYDFTLAHFPELTRLSGEGLSGKGWLLPGTAWRFNELSWATRLTEDQLARVGPDGASAADRVASKIQLRALVKARDAAALAKFLETWTPGSRP
jgi:aminopeptidase N